jgi:rhodanese-related sulfurtransferase
MRAPSFSISPLELWSLIGSPQALQIMDVRRREFYDAGDGVIPTAVWRDVAALPQWAASLDRSRPVVLACKLNKEMSQTAAAQLRADGFDACVLADGYAGWTAAGLPLVSKAAVERFAGRRPSVWVTRRRPKIDRVACPWLIRRFIDADARILFVDPPYVPAVAQEAGGIPFDIPDVELSHDGERCSFDTMLKLFGLEAEPSLARLALIVRGADTARPDLAPEAAGLHAVSLGLSALAGDDDHGMLRQGFLVYDALFAWLRFAAEERHNWPAKAA